MTDTNYEKLREKALKQLRSGESLFGKNGAFAPMLKGFIEKALEAEMEDHLDQEQREQGNKRNGKRSKTVRSPEGAFSISAPKDRQSSFEPQIIRKRETILADNLADKIIGLFGLGTGYKGIQKHIKEIYDFDISVDTLARITDRVIPLVEAWRSRALEAVYSVVWLDAMFFKVREDNKVKKKALYTVLGINSEGKKEVLGVYLIETEGARFWLQVLSDLQNRGVKDILIACIDNLKGFSEAIQSIYPQTEIQSCIVHQVRNSLKYVSSKDQKQFLMDLKKVYKASTLAFAEEELAALSKKWGEKYPVVIKSWENNWHELSTYFDYAPAIRKLIYTTNMIEGYHRQVRKVTKSKGAFTSDMAGSGN